jgi:hypothetical protein
MNHFTIISQLIMAMPVATETFTTTTKYFVYTINFWLLNTNGLWENNEHFNKTYLWQIKYLVNFQR